MKTKYITATLVLLFASQVMGQTLSDNMEKARELEELLSIAIVNNDVDELNRLWAEDFTVNNPANQVIQGKNAVLDRVRSGVIHYDSYMQEIESVVAINEMLIVMGKEIITPIGNAPGAGQILERRYTNIWVNTGDNWVLNARHANIICEP